MMRLTTAFLVLSLANTVLSIPCGSSEECFEMDEIKGNRYIKSIHSTFLRARYCNSGYDTFFTVDMTPHNKQCEQWIIEWHEGFKGARSKIAIRTAHGPMAYLRAHPDGSVNLSEWGKPGLLWQFERNDDHSWSFKSVYGTWLRAQPHGRVSLQSHVGADEKFSLVSW